MLNDRYLPFLVFWGSAIKTELGVIVHLERFWSLRPLNHHVLDAHTALRLVHQHHFGGRVRE